MQTQPLTNATIAGSVWAVPPLCRDADGSFSVEENRRLVEHITSGGISKLLYGGNAIFYHLTLREYAAALALLKNIADDSTLMIPAVGPAFGTMMDQLPILKDQPFPTAMILPQGDITTSAGIASGIERFVSGYGRPVVVYLKYDGKLRIDDVKRLVEGGMVCAIKYAVVRGDYSHDEYLRRLVDAIDPAMVLSGLGDQPAIVHMRDFGVGGFTTGCGCVAPRLSADLLRAIQAGDFESAEQIRETFLPLEDLRNAHGPITVLHEAVAAAGIAKTGPIQPLLSEPEASLKPQIAKAAIELLRATTSSAV